MSKREQAREAAEWLRALGRFPGNRGLFRLIAEATELPRTAAAETAAGWAASAALMSESESAAPGDVLRAAADRLREMRTLASSREAREAAAALSVALWRLAVEAD